MNKSQEAIFTMGIASYNNYRYLKEAVDSVLSQTYPNIEIIISNDGSPDFDEEEIAEYIDKKKADNITNISIYNHKENMGTVRNINYICEQAHGEYIMFMAADDVLDHDTVLNQFVDSFQNENKDVDVICGKTALCGKKVSKASHIREYVPSQHHIDIIKKRDSQKLFSKLSYDMFIPTTSTCYRMDVFRKMGIHDEKCFIIEDFTFALNMALHNEPFGWIDFVAARHRDGGISHGNERVPLESYRRYRFDEIYIYATYILPHKEWIDEEDCKTMEGKWELLKNDYLRAFVYRGDRAGADYRDYDEKLCRHLIEEKKQGEKTDRRKRKVREFCDISIKWPILRVLALLVCIFILELVWELHTVAAVLSRGELEGMIAMNVVSPAIALQIILFCFYAGIIWYGFRVALIIGYKLHMVFHPEGKDR